MLVTEIYNTLKQSQLVNTLEEYSTQWLNKHKTTASYLIHKKRDLSINAKVSCLINIKNKITEIENSNKITKILETESLLTLKKLQNLIKFKISTELGIKIVM
jgi:hypothetical protein